MKPHKKIKSHNLINQHEGYYTFNDLNFYPHRNGLGGKQAIMEFDNGHRISVVGGGYGLYGDGVSTFEIWRSCDEDVKGWLTKEEITKFMVDIQKLGPNEPRHELGF